MSYRSSATIRPLALLLIALSANLIVGCGDDASSEALDGGGGGDASASATSGTGTGTGTGPSTSSGAGTTTGSGVGQSATVGSGSGGGYGEGGSGEPPPPPPIEPPDPDEVTCDELDETKSLVLYLSADDSNSMASPAEAREALRAGNLPWSVRTYEFLNYYDVDFPAPAYPDVALFADAKPATEPGAFDLMLAVRAHDAPEVRRPMTITFVADTSGSMDGSPMSRERAAMRAIAGQLAEGDIVNVVTWNTENLAVLEGRHVTGPDDGALLGVIDDLVAGGGTDLDGGLRAGYELARQHYGADRLNRVVMISDGGANVGETSADVIGESSDDADGEGIYLVGVGVGPIETYSDQLMDIVTDKGRGAYVYLDTVDEAERMFGDRFDETMEVAARDVRVEVTLPWYFQMLRFYGEDYSEDPEEVDPQHLSPGDVTVIMQTIKACSADVVNPADPVKLKVTWETPLARQPREAVLEVTLGEMLAQDHGKLDQASAVVAFAEALKSGMPADLESALAKVQALDAGDDPDFAEIEQLLSLYAGM